MGCTAPTSLLECMIVTSTVAPGFTAAATSSTPTSPSLSTPTRVTLTAPCPSSAARQASIAGCSIFVVTICGVTPAASRPFARARAMWMAWLSLSEPQLVKITSEGVARIIFASRSRAVSTAAAQGRPNAWPCPQRASAGSGRRLGKCGVGTGGCARTELGLPKWSPVYGSISALRPARTPR